jgi:hypothetical protein
MFAVPLDICARTYVSVEHGWNEPVPTTSLLPMCLRAGPAIDAVPAELKGKRSVLTATNLATH